jgi:hypothetical protein
MTAADARAALQSALWSAFEHACVYSDSDTAERLSAIIMKVGKDRGPSQEQQKLDYIWRRVDELTRGRPDEPA